ncbi:MAG: glycoside hydrolase family 5 protein, partial [Ruminococcaceae bacterium]|nr:glycoside hydrolase family 5 protein [Oscillospiraceae bacterium]
QWDAESWRDGYTAAIPKLRDAGIKNTIMVDAAGWGQYGESIRKYGKEVFDSDPDKNTMFSIHMYGTAGKNQRTITSNIKGATDQELCVIVGEFGHNHGDGDVDEAYIMQYCAENALGYLGWSWKGNGGGVEYLDIAKDWSGNELSEDWGEILVNGDNGIKKNSKLCTVFE